MLFDKTAFLGVVFKPPNCNSLSNCYESIPEMVPQYIHIIIVGDFNFDIMKPTANVSQLKSWVLRNGLSLVNEVFATTHYQDAQTLIDHFFHGPYLQLDGSAYSKFDVLYITYDLHFDINVESTQP